MNKLKRNKRLFKPTVKQKHPKTLRNLAIAFAIVIVSGALYLRFLQPHTLEAKQRVQLESTTHQLQDTKKALEAQKTLDAQQQAEQKKQLDEVNQKLQETEKALQAKRSIPSPTKTYAAELPAQPVQVSSGGSCAEWMTQAGIPHTTATDKLILNESGCRTNARNPSSGACGIPQAYPCSKLPCPLNDSGAVCQLQWMDTYVKGRYGSWESALATWYSRCGSPQGCWY